MYRARITKRRDRQPADRPGCGHHPQALKSATWRCRRRSGRSAWMPTPGRLPGGPTA